MSHSKSRQIAGRWLDESDSEYRARRMQRLGELMDEMWTAGPDMVAREEAVLARVREERAQRVERP